MQRTFIAVLTLWLLSPDVALPQSQRTTLSLADAALSAIEHHPAVRIQQRDVDLQDALQQQAAAPFDQVLDGQIERGRIYSPVTAGPLMDLTASNVSSLGASYSKLLRSGIRLGGIIDADRLLGGNITTTYTGGQIVIPLGRGLGRDAATADYTAASREADGSRFESRHVTAAVVLGAITSYWGLVGAQRSLDVAWASAERGERLVENMRALVAGDQMARADLAPVLANLADRQAARIAAEQIEIEARQRLMLAIGVSPDAVEPGVDLEDFPTPLSAAELAEGSLTVERYISLALAERADLRGAGLRTRAARIRRDGAQNGVLPQIDFGVDVGYSGLGNRGLARYFGGLGTRIDGPDVVARLHYRFPSENSLARGRLAATDAQLHQAELRAADLARTIESEVRTAFSGVRNALSRLEQARSSVEAFAVALQGERDKLTLGVGSVVNLLTIEDRLTAASSREVDAWQAYAEALIQFRYATGSLVPAAGPLPPLSRTTLTGLPALPTP